MADDFVGSRSQIKRLLVQDPEQIEREFATLRRERDEARMMQRGAEYNEGLVMAECDDLRREAEHRVELTRTLDAVDRALNLSEPAWCPLSEEEREWPVIAAILALRQRAEAARGCVETPTSRARRKKRNQGDP